MKTQELQIKFKDGDKESELVLHHIDEQHKLSLIDGFFKFFDINVEFQEMAETYLKVGKSYKDFYDNVDTTVFVETNEIIETEPLSAESWGWPSEETKETIIKEDHHETGIKIKSGVSHYRCHYVCPKCRKSSNRYIKENETKITCMDCRKHMSVRRATNSHALEQDSFGNFFVAGNFVRQY